MFNNVFIPQGHSVSPSSSRPFCWLPAEDETGHVSKPLELKAAKDRLFYQSGKLKNDLLTLAEAGILSDVTNDIVRLVWRGMKMRAFDIIIPSKRS